MIDWIKEKWHQEGLSVVLLATILIIVVKVFFFSGTKQVNNADYKGATIGEITNNYSKGKRFTPFVEGFGGLSTNGEKRAEAGARVGVRVEF